MSYDPTRSWDIAQTELTLANDNLHWLYVKVPTAEGVTTSEFFASEDHVDPISADGYIIYKIGYIEPVVNGQRVAHLLWGNSHQIEEAPSDGSVYGRMNEEWAKVPFLDANDLIPSIFLPSYVDDVLEFSTFSALPANGVQGIIYVTLDDNLTYRWSGTAYIEISKSLALGETAQTAYRGDRGKTAYDHSQIADGTNPHGTTFSNIAALPTTLAGYGITDAYTKTEVNLLPVSTFANDAGYLTSFTETDPTVPAWAKQPTKPAYNTSEVTELGNLYYTDARARAALSLTTNGSSGASTYNQTTGVLNVPVYTLSGLGGQPQLNGTGFVKANGTTISYDPSTYEPAFSKNTAFNKNFGTTPGTVLEGRTFGTAANYNYGDFIQNQNTVLQIGNFSINGTGRANVFDASQYNVLGAQIASANLSDGENLAKLNAANTFTQSQTIITATSISDALNLIKSNDADRRWIHLAQGSCAADWRVGMTDGSNGNYSLSFYNAAGNTLADALNPGVEVLRLNGLTNSGDVVLPNGSIQATTAKLTNLTDGYLPYQVVGALGNSPVYTDGTNVGIGMTVPLYKMDVRGVGIQARFTSSDRYGDGGIQVGSNGADDPHYYGTLTWDQATLETRLSSHDGDLVFNTSPIAGALVPRMTILDTGNVGIGTTTPGYKLQIGSDIWSDLGANYSLAVAGDAVIGNAVSGSSPKLRIYEGTTGDFLTIQKFSSYSVINDHYSAKLALQPYGGNVGIGTTAPDKLLTVAGEMKATTATFTGVGATAGVSVLGLDANGLLTTNVSALNYDHFTLSVNDTNNFNIKSGYFLDLNNGKGVSVSYGSYGNGASANFNINVASLDTYLGGVTSSWVVPIYGTDNRKITLSLLGELAVYNASRLQGKPISSSTPTTGQVLAFDGTYWAPTAAGSGSGTVTSVGLSMPSIFTVSGSPVTITGTLAASLVSQSANLVFASPNGAAGTPAFRKIVVGDISATGTPDATTYLRGDGSWGTPAGVSGYWTSDTYGIKYSSGNVGIGGSSSAVYKLSVSGMANVSYSGTNSSYALYVSSHATIPAGVFIGYNGGGGVSGIEYAGNTSGIFLSQYPTTSTSESVIAICRSSSGTPAVGIGSNLVFRASNSDGGNILSDYAKIGSVSTSITSGLETGDLTFSVKSSGTLYERMRLTSSGLLKTAQYSVTSLNAAPTSATATGTTGEVRFASDGIYVCIATNTWRKAILSTF